MSKTIVVTAAQKTLFHVSSQQYGDPLGAVVLAEISDIFDPWLLPQLIKITIPDTLGPSTGGLPASGNDLP